MNETGQMFFAESYDTDNRVKPNQSNIKTEVFYQLPFKENGKRIRSMKRGSLRYLSLYEVRDCIIIHRTRQKYIKISIFNLSWMSVNYPIYQCSFNYEK